MYLKENPYICEVHSDDVSCTRTITLYVNFPRVIFSSPEPKAAHGLIGCDSSRRLCVRESITLSNLNMSATSLLIVIKFYLEHHWGGGLSLIDFGPYPMRTLVSMATDSSHRVIMRKIL